MNFSYEVILIKIVAGEEDKRGNPTTEEVEESIFCEKLSIGQQEHYQASATDMKPTLKIEVMAEDYLDQSTLIFEDKKYRVIRTYKNKKGRIEIVAEAHIRDNKS